MYSFQVILEVSCDSPAELDELLTKLREIGTSPGVDAYYWRPSEDAEEIDISGARLMAQTARTQ